MDSRTKSVILVVLGGLSLSLAIFVLEGTAIGSCTLVSPGQPYTCGVAGVFADPSTELGFAILTSFGALAFGMATFTLLESYEKNRRASSTESDSAVTS